LTSLIVINIILLYYTRIPPGVHSAVHSLGGVQNGPYSNIYYIIILYTNASGGWVVLGDPETPQYRSGDYATTDCVDSVFATD
jgi:hypothetical protein